MIKSPKERFQESQIARERIANITADPIFIEACDMALLQLLSRMPEIPESIYKMMGATNFVYILKTIHEKTEQPKETTSKGLNYNAGV